MILLQIVLICSAQVSDEWLLFTSLEVHIKLGLLELVLSWVVFEVSVMEFPKEETWCRLPTVLKHMLLLKYVIVCLLNVSKDCPTPPN